MLSPQVWFNGFAARCHLQVEEELEDKQGCQQGYTSHLKIIISCTTLKYPKEKLFFNTIILFQDVLPGADSESAGRDDVSPGGARALSEDSALEERLVEQARCALEIVKKPMCAVELVEQARRAAVKRLKAPGALSSCCFGSRWLEGS